jgi:hypothetical protein
MMNIQEHIDALDKMVVDHASLPDIRSQIAFIAREVAALQADSERLAIAYSQSQEEHEERKPDSPPLSDNAKRLLFEIEACCVSTPKGLSIMRVTETVGDYLPHLYPTPEPSSVRAIDLNELIQAADDLVEAGWLEAHAVENKVTEFRRTSRAIRL